MNRKKTKKERKKAKKKQNDILMVSVLHISADLECMISQQLSHDKALLC